MVNNSSIVNGLGSTGGRAEAQPRKRRAPKFTTQADRQEVGPEGTGGIDRICGRVILRHAREGDAEHLDSFDVGGGTEWLDEVSGIVGGLLSWRSEPSAAQRDRHHRVDLFNMLLERGRTEQS